MVSIAKQAALASGKCRATLATGKNRMISTLPEFRDPGGAWFFLTSLPSSKQRPGASTGFQGP
jgi:hypothetical protein